MASGRTLMNFQPLPPRAAALDRQQVDTDIRDAIARAEARLNEMAQRYGVTGWTIDLGYGQNGYDYGLEGHTIIGRLRLVRPS